MLTVILMGHRRKTLFWFVRMPSNTIIPQVTPVTWLDIHTLMWNKAQKHQSIVVFISVLCYGLTDYPLNLPKTKSSLTSANTEYLQTLSSSTGSSTLALVYLLDTWVHNESSDQRTVLKVTLWNLIKWCPRKHINTEYRQLCCQSCWIACRIQHVNHIVAVTLPPCGARSSTNKLLVKDLNQETRFIKHITAQLSKENIFTLISPIIHFADK